MLIKSYISIIEQQQKNEYAELWEKGLNFQRKRACFKDISVLILLISPH